VFSGGTAADTTVIVRRSVSFRISSAAEVWIKEHPVLVLIARVERDRLKDSGVPGEEPGEELRLHRVEELLV
jgi:hypothetical protein